MQKKGEYLFYIFNFSYLTFIKNRKICSEII